MSNLAVYDNADYGVHMDTVLMCAYIIWMFMIIAVAANQVVLKSNATGLSVTLIIMRRKNNSRQTWRNVVMNKSSSFA
jgi:hypothetical protein